jgi:hypothetical protein
MSYNSTSCPAPSMVPAGASRRTLSQTVTAWHFLDTVGLFLARVTLNESFGANRFQDASENDGV